MKDLSLPSVLHHIFNPDSRKVGFGWWLFIISTVLLREKFIDSNDWMFCTAFASGLVGGGTIADSMISSKYGGKNGAVEPKV